MSRRPRVPGVLKAIGNLNPDVDFVLPSGAQHWQIRKDGRLVGIYPSNPAKEGLAGNTKSQLRRAGIRLAAGGSGQERERS